jgi:hypothetical protein
MKKHSNIKTDEFRIRNEYGIRFFVERKYLTETVTKYPFFKMQIERGTEWRTLGRSGRINDFSIGRLGILDISDSPENAYPSFRAASNAVKSFRLGITFHTFAAVATEETKKGPKRGRPRKAKTPAAQLPLIARFDGPEPFTPPAPVLVENGKPYPYGKKPIIQPPPPVKPTPPPSQFIVEGEDPIDLTPRDREPTENTTVDLKTTNQFQNPESHE